MMSSALQGGFLLSTSKIVFGQIDRVQTCNTHRTKPQREYNNTQVQSADNFSNVTSRPSGHHFEPFFAPHFETQLSLARLIKVEIVSPYYGIFISTSVGNPTVLRERFLRNRQVLRLRRRRSIPEVYIKEPRAIFLCQTSPKPPQP